MVTRDLMIGDWVLHDGEPYQIRRLRIHGVNRDGEDYPAVCVGKQKGVGLIVEKNEIEPITITKEILVKNGFKEDRYGQMILDEDLGASEIYFVLQDGDEDYWWWVVGCQRITNIKYVHQLQQAMRICRIEKEIIL